MAVVLVELCTSKGMSSSGLVTFLLGPAILLVWKGDDERLIILERYFSTDP
jgi:hypothetical protein